jgi:hypothetical protein
MGTPEAACSNGLAITVYNDKSDVAGEDVQVGASFAFRFGVGIEAGIVAGWPWPGNSLDDWLAPDGTLAQVGRRRSNLRLVHGTARRRLCCECSLTRVWCGLAPRPGWQRRCGRRDRCALMRY